MNVCYFCKSIETATPASPKKKYRFCPMCGRPLFAPEPIPADAIHNFWGEWVWVERIGTPTKIDGWAFMATPTIAGFFEQMLFIDDYGKTWVAYKYRP